MIAALPFAGIHIGTNAALFATVGVLLVMCSSARGARCSPCRSCWHVSFCPRPRTRRRPCRPPDAGRAAGACRLARQAREPAARGHLLARGLDRLSRRRALLAAARVGRGAGRALAARRWLAVGSTDARGRLRRALRRRARLGRTARTLRARRGQPRPGRLAGAPARRRGRDLGRDAARALERGRANGRPAAAGLGDRAVSRRARRGHARAVRVRAAPPARRGVGFARRSGADGQRLHGGGARPEMGRFSRGRRRRARAARGRSAPRGTTRWRPASCSTMASGN
jgi:hypothetical protein